MSKSLTLASRPNEPYPYKTFSSYRDVRSQVKEQTQEEHFRKHVIIFGLAWIVGDDSNFLAACTSSGELVVWGVPGLEGVVDCSRPIFRHKICNGKLYSIKLECVESKSLLIVSGDDGVLVYDWEKDIVKTHLQPQQPAQKKKKNSTLLSPVSSFRPHPSPLESRGIEVNDFEVLTSNKTACLFGAAGDSFGAYKWNLETGQLVTNYASTGGGYLHTLRLLPSDGSNSPNTLLTGGEGGRCHIWDVNNDKLIDQLDLTAVNAAASASAPLSSISSPSLNRNNSKRSKNNPSRWISSICAYDQNWFTVAGGTAGSGGGGSSRGSSSSSSGGGFLATYHAPTRSLVSFVDTRETPQQLAIVPPSVESASTVQHNLVSVGNEGVVSHFNALTLERTRRLWSTPPSAYATAVSDDGRHTAVAGVGCYVDIFDISGEKSTRLSIC